MGEITVNQHYGHLLCGINNVPVIFLRRLEIIGSDQDNRIHALGQQQLKIVLSGRQLIAGTAQERIIAVLSQIPLQMVDRVRQEGIRRVGAHYADGLHRIQAKPARKHIRSIAKLRHNVKNLLSGLVTDIGIPVDYARNGCDGHAGLFGHIINIQMLTSWHICKPLQKKRNLTHTSTLIILYPKRIGKGDPAKKF